MGQYATCGMQTLLWSRAVLVGRACSDRVVTQAVLAAEGLEGEGDVLGKRRAGGGGG